MSLFGILCSPGYIAPVDRSHDYFVIVKAGICGQPLISFHYNMVCCTAFLSQNSQMRCATKTKFAHTDCMNSAMSKVLYIVLLKTPRLRSPLLYH